jgi:hypothetical protein
LNALLQILSSHYNTQDTHPLNQIQALPLDTPSKELLSASYTTLYALSLNLHLDSSSIKEIYFLCLRPLLYTVRKALHTTPEELPSLYETAVQEIWWSENPEVFAPLLAILVPHLSRSCPSYHQKLYTHLSSKTTLEPLRAHYIQLLEDQPHIIQALASIPNRSGYRYEEKQQMEQLLSSLKKVTQSALPVQGLQVSIQVAGESSPLYLQPHYIAHLLTPQEDIQSQYSGSLHNVCSLKDLHFKQKPFHPLMEYAVYSFTSRLMGVATAPTILAKIQINGKKTYPVLISQTIPGQNLKTVLKENPHFTPQNDHFTWAVLIDILLRPGDKKANNHIVNSQNQLICIDNDISFVEPVISKGLIKTVNFCSILFTLSDASLLDPSVLETFCTLNPDLILEGWLQDLLLQEQKYQALFSEQEITTFYNEDKESRFIPTLLLPAGAITSLYTQFLLLQQYLSDNKAKKLHPTDLFDALITLKGKGLEENRIGPYLKRYYQKTNSIHPEEKLKGATKRDPNQSIMSSRALGITTGTVPTSQEIAQKQLFSLEKAHEEFMAYSLIRGAGNIKVATLNGEQALTVDFAKITKEGSPDLERQTLMLKGLHALMTLQKLAPTSISLTSCAVLTEESLKPFLHPKLTCLDLRGSSIPSLPIEIETFAPNLEELHLRGCPNLQYIEKWGVFKSDPIILPHLKVLNVARCPNLTSIQVNSLCIIDVKANNNPKLKTIKAPFVILNITNSSQVRITLDFQPLGKQAWANHFGDVGEEPPLPSNIAQILSSPCFIWPSKKTHETHILVLIPATVNGRPFTLKSLGEFIQNPRTGPATEYSYFNLGEHQDAPVSQSYWTLMSRGIIDGSRDQKYKTQFAQIATLAKDSGVAYVVPKVLEAATCILMHHVSTGQKIFTASSETYTRCQEFYSEKHERKLVVGGFSSGGLDIRYDYYGHETHGVGVCRQFLGH